MPPSTRSYITLALLFVLLSGANGASQASSISLVGDDAFITLGDGTADPVSFVKSQGKLSVDGGVVAGNFELTGSGDSLGSLVVLVNAMNTRLVTAESMIVELRTNLSSTQSELAATRARLLSAEGTAVQLTGNLTAVQAEVTQLKMDSDDLTERLGWAEGNVTEARADTTDLRSDIRTGTVDVNAEYTLNVSDYGDSLVTAYEAVPTSCLVDYVLQLPVTMTISSTQTLKGHPCDHRIIIRGSADTASRDNYVITCTTSLDCIRFDPRVEDGGYGLGRGVRLEGFRLESTGGLGDGVPEGRAVIKARYATTVIIDNVLLKHLGAGDGWAMEAMFGATIHASRFYVEGHHRGVHAAQGSRIDLSQFDIQVDGTGGDGATAWLGSTISLMHGSIDHATIGLGANYGSTAVGHQVTFHNTTTEAAKPVLSAFGASSSVCLYGCAATTSQVYYASRRVSYVILHPYSGSSTLQDNSCVDSDCTASCSVSSSRR